MPRKSLAIGQILTALAETPLSLAKLTDGLALKQLHTPPGPDEWSANDVLAHMRSCADVWGNCIEIIIIQDTPTIRAVNPRTWIKSTDYTEQKFRSSLRDFTAQRASLLALLKPLANKAWTRKAMVSGAGKPLELTVHSYAQRLAIHEQPHLKQIARIANTIYE